MKKQTTILRPIPEILQDVVNGKKPKDLNAALGVLIAWYSKGCPSKEEMLSATRSSDETCDICNMSDPNDTHHGNPYVYHSSSTPPCEVKIIT